MGEAGVEAPKTSAGSLAPRRLDKPWASPVEAGPSHCEHPDDDYCCCCCMLDVKHRFAKTRVVTASLTTLLQV